MKRPYRYFLKWVRSTCHRAWACRHVQPLRSSFDQFCPSQSLQHWRTRISPLSNPKYFLINQITDQESLLFDVNLTYTVRISDHSSSRCCWCERVAYCQFDGECLAGFFLRRASNFKGKKWVSVNYKLNAKQRRAYNLAWWWGDCSTLAPRCHVHLDGKSGRIHFLSTDSCRSSSGLVIIIISLQNAVPFETFRRELNWKKFRGHWDWPLCPGKQLRNRWWLAKGVVCVVLHVGTARHSPILSGPQTLLFVLSESRN